MTTWCGVRRVYSSFAFTKNGSNNNIKCKRGPSTHFRGSSLWRFLEILLFFLLAFLLPPSPRIHGPMCSLFGVPALLFVAVCVFGAHCSEFVGSCLMLSVRRDKILPKFAPYSRLSLCFALSNRHCNPLLWLLRLIDICFDEPSLCPYHDFIVLILCLIFRQVLFLPSCSRKPLLKP